MKKYKAFAVTEIGFSHLEKGIVRQDNAKYYNNCGTLKNIIAVADGHGSKQYFRSDIGSRIAVDTAYDKLYEYLSKINYLTLSQEERAKTIQQLIHSIITQWHREVKDDYTTFPFKEDELNSVEDKYSIKYKQGIDFEKAYGCTLLAVAMRDDYCIGIHIGDGKCVAIYDDGSIDEPIPWDTNCHLNECTSICDKNAAEEFRFYVWKDKMPIAIFIASDGIDDTFAGTLHLFYLDLFLKFVETGYEKTVESLQSSLAEISARGSKDDVSIAGIIMLNVNDTVKLKIEDCKKRLKYKNELFKCEEKMLNIEFLLQKSKRIHNKKYNEDINLKDNDYFKSLYNIEKLEKEYNEIISKISNIKSEINNKKEALTINDKIAENNEDIVIEKIIGKSEDEKFD